GNHVVGVAQVLRAQLRADAGAAPFELLALGAMLELQLVEVDDAAVDHALPDLSGRLGFAAHRSISPKTMSMVPMMATTSAIMWPRAISSMAERCGKPAARILRRHGLLAPSDMR